MQELIAVNESGVDESVTSKFLGSTVQVGGTKRGENPTIPDEEGGELNKASGRYVSSSPETTLVTQHTTPRSRIIAFADCNRQTKANEFEGKGGPEDKVAQAQTDRPGDDDVTGV